MGFGAGFAAGFIPSFQAQRDRSHERDTDEFRYRMETLVKNKEKYETKKAASDSAAKLAKEIVMATEQPPEAAAAAYNLLINGASYDTVYEQFSKKTFKPAPVDDTVASGIAEPVAPEASNAPAPAPKSKGVLGDMGVPDFMGMGNRADRIESRVGKTTGMTPEEIAQIDAGWTNPEMDSSGTWGDIPTLPKDAEEASMIAAAANDAAKANPSDPSLKTAAYIANRNLDAIRQQQIIKGDIDAHEGTGQGFGEARSSGDLVSIPNPKNDPNDPLSPRKLYVTATWDGANYIDGDGKVIPGAMARSRDERDAIGEVAKAVGKDASDYNKKAMGLAGMIRAAAGARSAVEHTQGAVLQDMTSSVAQIGQGVLGELSAAVSILGQAEQQTVDNLDPKALEENIASIKKMNDAYSQSAAGQLAKERLLFKAQNHLMAYYYGQAFDQTGKSLTQVEAEMFERMTAGGNDPKQFYESLAGNILPLMSQINTLGDTVNNHPEVAGYINRFGGVPEVFRPIPIEDLLKGDKGALDLLTVLEPYRDSVTGVDLKPPTGTQPPAAPAAGAVEEIPGYTYSGKKTPEGKPIYRDANGQEGTF